MISLTVDQLVILSVIQQNRDEYQDNWCTKGSTYLAEILPYRQDRIVKIISDLIKLGILEANENYNHPKIIPVRLTMKGKAARAEVAKTLFPDVFKVLLTRR